MRRPRSLPGSRPEIVSGIIDGPTGMICLQRPPQGRVANLTNRQLSQFGEYTDEVKKLNGRRLMKRIKSEIKAKGLWDNSTEAVHGRLVAALDHRDEVVHRGGFFDYQQ